MHFSSEQLSYAQDKFGSHNRIIAHRSYWTCDLAILLPPKIAKITLDHMRSWSILVTLWQRKRKRVSALISCELKREESQWRLLLDCALFHFNSHQFAQSRGRMLCNLCVAWKCRALAAWRSVHFDLAIVSQICNRDIFYFFIFRLSGEDFFMSWDVLLQLWAKTEAIFPDLDLEQHWA